MSAFHCVTIMPMGTPIIFSILESIYVLLSDSCRSAILLDVIAVSALVIYVFRVVLGYKQTWDRYQVSQTHFLLVICGYFVTWEHLSLVLMVCFLKIFSFLLIGHFMRKLLLVALVLFTFS